MNSPTGHQLAARRTAVTGPYQLESGIHLFTDWRFIDAGAPSYVDAAGKAVSVKGDGQLRPVWHQGINVPQGIQLVVERPVKSEPVEGPVGASILLDGGRYRSWSGANVSESEDGFHWRKTSVPGESPEQDRNELFFHATGIHGPGVFIDPSAPDSERYKMIFWSELGKGREALRERLYAGYVAQRPHDVDPVFEVRGRADALFGAVSGDGLHWRVIERPFLFHMADNPNTMYYDVVLKKYVLYTRTSWLYGRRAIGRSESDTFGPFPQPEMVVWPDLYRLASDDLYTNAKCLYPDTLDYHFLFPTVYHRATDACSIDLMSSPDGIHWFRPPGNPVVEGDADTFDDGCLFTHGGLVPLGGDQVGLPYKGSTFPHKYPRWSDRADKGVARYALWPTGRLVCVESVGEGYFATPVLLFKGRELRLNVKTPLTGEVRVEVVAIRSWIHKKKVEEVVPNRRFSDCDPIRGNYLSHVVTWQGESDLGHAEGQPVYLRFRLRAARLYAFELV